MVEKVDTKSLGGLTKAELEQIVRYETAAPLPDSDDSTLPTPVDKYINENRAFSPDTKKILRNNE